VEVTQEHCLLAKLHGACEVPEVGTPISSLSFSQLVWCERLPFTYGNRPLWTYGSGDGFGCFGSGDGFGSGYGDALGSGYGYGDGFGSGFGDALGSGPPTTGHCHHPEGWYIDQLLHH